MTTRQIRDLAIRLLGIYYLANAIIGVPQIFAIFTLSGKEAGYVVSYKFLPDLITMVLALLCIVKSRQIAAYLKRKTE